MSGRMMGYCMVHSSSDSMRNAAVLSIHRAPGRRTFQLVGQLGTWALFAVVASVAATLLGYVAYRKTTVPEIRIQMTLAGAGWANPLCCARTTALPSLITILTAAPVRAKGLDVGVAATVTYIGRRRFQVEAKDAEVWNEGKSAGTFRRNEELRYEG